MTVSVPATTSFEYAGNGISRAFSFPLRFLEIADLVVTVDGVEKVYPTHYAVTGAGNPFGGTVTFVMAQKPADGSLVRIQRFTAPKQIVDLEDNSKVPGDTLEAQLDRLAMVGQDATERLQMVGDLAGEVSAAEAAAERAEDAAAVAVAVADAAVEVPGNTPVVASGSTTARSLSDRFADIPSVLDFGAVGDGVTDDTLAFQSAATAAARFNTTLPLYAVPTADAAVVSVPAGHYLLTANIDPEGANIIWEADASVKFTGAGYLPGRLHRGGMKISSTSHFGILDQAATFAVKTRPTMDAPAGALGLTAPNQLSTYSDRDSVSMFADNEAPPAILAAGANYTATTLIPASPVDVTKLRVGMIIDTAHTPNKFSGFITGWELDGSEITVEGWYEVTGVAGTTATPSNGVDAYINPITKVWAFNGNVILGASSHANQAAGFELGTRNQKGHPASAYDTGRMVWGMDVVDFGPYRSSNGFIARGPYMHGVEASGSYENAFVASGRNGVTPQRAFVSYAGSATQFAAIPAGYGQAAVWSVGLTGDMTFGSGAASSTKKIDFRTSGTAAAYDVEILATGGSSTQGKGNLQLIAEETNVRALNTSKTNTPHQVQTLQMGTTGTPAAGIGAGLGFRVQTAAANSETGLSVEAIAEDVSSTAEDFSFVVKLMEAGATAAERFRVRANGQPVFKPPASADALGSNGEVTIEFTNNTTLTFKARGSDGVTRSATVTLS